MGVMVDEGKLKVDKFNEKNFQLWKMQNGALYILEGFMAAIGWKDQETDCYVK